MKRLGILSMVSALVVAAAMVICLGGMTPAAAQGKNSYSGNKSSGGSIDLKKKYGGTYGLPGRIEMKQKYRYESEPGSKIYSPYQSPTFGQSQGPVKIEQRQEMNQLIEESDEKKEGTDKESMPK